MLVKLSGDKYINSEAIGLIEPVAYPAVGSNLRWVVYTTSPHLATRLTQQQFDELMDCLPTPIESDRKRGKG